MLQPSRPDQHRQRAGVQLRSQLGDQVAAGVLGHEVPQRHGGGNLAAFQRQRPQQGLSQQIEGALG